MATSKEYLQFILEQLEELEEITYRQMMGEYIIYYHGKIAAYLCDDRLMVKPVKSAINLLPDAAYEPPYEGAKDMLVVDNVDDKMFLKALFEAMYPELPEPKRKAVKKNNNMAKVKKIATKDIKTALELVWEVFLEFEAPDYSEQGVEEFRNTLNDAGFVKQLNLYGAFINGELVGVLGMRSLSHISLFFVKAKHQRKGIGKKLFERMKKDYVNCEFTVNSSHYAVDIYEKLGFVAINSEQVNKGIRYTPMVFK